MLGRFAKKTGPMGKDRVTSMIQDRGAANQVSIGEGAMIAAMIVIEGDDNEVRLGNGVVLGSDDPAGGGTAIHIRGRGNVIQIGAGARVNSGLSIEGDNCRMIIGQHCILTFNANLRAGGVIQIGDATTMVKGALQVHETGSITIGRDCMISTLVYLSVSDIHPIYDRASGARINPPASITVGDHVWLGLRSMIMKGARIEDGAIVAAAALVSGHVAANTIVAGAPARVQRENVEWRRDFE